MNKEEKREYMRLWRKNNVQKIKEYQKKDYEKHRDGYLKRAEKQRNKLNKDEWKKYHQQWRDKNSDKVRKYSKVGYEKKKEIIAEYKRKYISENLEKRLAHIIVGNAVANKKIIKPSTCSNGCEDAHRIEAHHPDYSKPLEVIWLCSKCHHKIHTYSIIKAE